MVANIQEVSAFSANVCRTPLKKYHIRSCWGPKTDTIKTYIHNPGEKLLACSTKKNLFLSENKGKWLNFNYTIYNPEQLYEASLMTTDCSYIWWLSNGALRL